MKIKSFVNIIATIATITLFTACGTTGKVKKSAAAQAIAPQPAQATGTGIRQLSAQPAELVEFTKDSSGNVATNRLTSHLITDLPKKRSFGDTDGSPDFEKHKALESTMLREYELVWTALEHRKNLDVLGTKYGATTNELEVITKLLAPTIVGGTNGAVPSVPPALGLGAIYHNPAGDDAELRRQYEEVQFQQWKARQYRAKGFK
jgi:hypothetical protein